MSSPNRRSRRSGRRSGRTWKAMQEVGGTPSTMARWRTGTGRLAVPPGTEGAVECAACGVWVRALASGRPRSHAAGGWGTSHMNGHPACPGSGSVA